ncbi:hypothetical protein ACWEC4_44925 [Streptomyces sp. NPDC005055]
MTSLLLDRAKATDAEAMRAVLRRPTDLYVVGQTVGNTSLDSPATQPLPSGSVAVYLTDYGSNNEIDFNIFDPNYSTQDSVASFHSHQDWAFLSSSDCWADTFNYIGHYTLDCDSSDWYENNHEYGNPGIIVCSVQYHD